MSNTSFLPRKRTVRPDLATTIAITAGSKYERWLPTRIAGPSLGMCSTPSISMSAYGTSDGRLNAIATRCSSSPTSGTFLTPGETSRFSVGQRRAAAMNTIRGSGLTTTGWPTADISGVS